MRHQYIVKVVTEVVAKVQQIWGLRGEGFGPHKVVITNNQHKYYWGHRVSHNSDKPFDTKTRIPNTIVDFNDESLIESSIFNTNYEFDSELESIDSNDVVSFDGNNYEYTNHYNVDEYYQEEDVDKQLFDWEKENERMQLRLQMLRELEI